MIEVRHLRHTYAGGTRALDDVSLTLEPGGIRALLGRSGSGKTTLLMCLGRFLAPEGGQILLDGEDIRSFGEVELRQRLGVVFQDLHLFPHLSVMANLTLAPIRVLGISPRDARRRAAEALERFDIAGLAASYPAQISRGQAQRVAITRALLLEPRYLLLDEPTSALDVQTSRELGRWLLGLREETTFVLVTHDLPFAREVAEGGIRLAKGRVAASGTLTEILRGFDDDESLLSQPAEKE